MRCVTLALFAGALLAACSKSSPPAATGGARTNTTITGTVVERLDGPPYSFLRLETDKGLTWVAVPMTEVPRKAKVTVKNGAILKNFESKQAGRKFDAVVFGVMDKL